MTIKLNSITDFVSRFPLDPSIKSTEAVVDGFLYPKNEIDYQIAKLVYEQNPKRVWSVVKHDGYKLVKNGFHFKDQLYMLITIHGTTNNEEFLIEHGKEANND